jgi:prepilin-type N-terminal cleavage/methylation domain-containing protein
MSSNVKRRLNDISGYSLIEVIIAMVIFSMVIVTLMSALTNADKIKARGTTVASVATIAQNEAELIKNIAQLSGKPHDTAYEIVYGKKEYSVERKIIKPESMDILSSSDSIDSLDEIEITVSEKNKPANSWRFNLLQGQVQ